MVAIKNSVLVQGEDDYQYDSNHYYGRNDMRPNSLGKRVCIYIALVLFSPLLLFLLVPLFLYIVYFFATDAVNESQIKSNKIMTCDSVWYRPPGKRLRVVPTGKDAKGLPTEDDTTPEGASSDVLVSPDFVRDDGHTMDTCKHLSLRKSIEVTLQEAVMEGKHGAAIAADRDRDRPRYLLHGRPEPWWPQSGEIWFTHARTGTWAAFYSWSTRLSLNVPSLEGSSFWSTICRKLKASLLDYDQSIDLSTCPDVMGYAYLVEVADYDEFYATDRVFKITDPRMANMPELTPETKRKIFVRYNYNKLTGQGNFPKGDPDAYIFKGRTVIEEANLRVIHRYRIMKPVVGS